MTGSATLPITLHSLPACLSAARSSALAVPADAAARSLPIAPALALSPPAIPDDPVPPKPRG